MKTSSVLFRNVDFKIAAENAAELLRQKLIIKDADTMCLTIGGTELVFRDHEYGMTLHGRLDSTTARRIIRMISEFEDDEF